MATGVTPTSHFGYHPLDNSFVSQTFGISGVYAATPRFLGVSLADLAAHSLPTVPSLTVGLNDYRRPFRIAFLLRNGARSGSGNASLADQAAAHTESLGPALTWLTRELLRTLSRLVSSVSLATAL
ncbi:unnamed protein product [Peniophora sp. CBMAI 1063]|nr:unnamed protein product [Peniophora sp. CBMAI 1063]